MEETRNESVKKLKDMLEGIDFCMLTTISDGKLKSRPMSTQKLEFNGDLLFLTNEDTHKVDEINKNDHVNVAYSQPDDNTFISVCGRAEISKDKAKIEELWNPIMKAWFPKGLDDPQLCLLTVKVDEAEYWDSSSSTLVQIAGFVKAIATGTEADYGEYGKIDF